MVSSAALAVVSAFLCLRAGNAALIGSEGRQTLVVDRTTSQDWPQADYKRFNGEWAPGYSNYKGPKVFFSKNSCATVLYCLKEFYANGISATKTVNVKGAFCQKCERDRSTSFFCRSFCSPRSGWRTQTDPDESTAHRVCAATNVRDANRHSEDPQHGCGEWMQPLMMQAATTLGTSSLSPKDGYNLYLDFKDPYLIRCLPRPGQPWDKKIQDCVNRHLDEALEEAKYFFYFKRGNKDFFCGPSCENELKKAKELQKKGKLTIIELQFDEYLALFFPDGAPRDCEGRNRNKWCSVGNPTLPPEALKPEALRELEQAQGGAIVGRYLKEKIKPHRSEEEKALVGCLAAGECRGDHRTNLWEQCCNPTEKLGNPATCLLTFNQRPPAAPVREIGICQ